MRVNNNNIPPISIGGPDSGRRAERADGDKRAGADQIQLSTVAQSGAEAHTERLESLRMRVASGTYRPSADEVAGSMIDEMLR